jgi:hypothetical protein
VLRQPLHHQLPLEPRREASNLPDLLGLRRLGSYTRVNVRRHLPRVRRADLLALLGVTELLSARGPAEWMVEAALAASALPDLTGKSPEAVAARRAVVLLAKGRVPSRTVAGWLRVSERAVLDLRRAGADPELVEAIERQLYLMRELPQARPPALPSDAAATVQHPVRQD